MATIYYENDADIALLKGKKIAVIGYGSQGHAHALNMKDSGQDVRIGLHEGSRSKAKAEAEGLRVVSVAEAAREADIIMVVIPDPIQGKVYEEQIQPNLEPGNTLMFAHGFNVRYGFIVAPKDVDVSMVAPKAPGHRVREVFIEGSGVPALVAIHQDASGNALANALAYCQGDRLCSRRRVADYLCRGDRNRPVWRADGPVRGCQRTWSRPVSRSWSMPATNPRSPILSVCTNSS